MATKKTKNKQPETKKDFTEVKNIIDYIKNIGYDVFEKKAADLNKLLSGLLLRYKDNDIVIIDRIAYDATDESIIIYTTEGEEYDILDPDVKIIDFSKIQYINK